MIVRVRKHGIIRDIVKTYPIHSRPGGGERAPSDQEGLSPVKL